MTMVKLALRGIRASLGRLILTTIAIVAGVGFVAGAFILSDSLSRTFNSLFDKANSTVDAQIQVADLDFGRDVRTIPDTLTAQVAALPQVAKAEPQVNVDPESNFRAFTLLDAAGNKVEPRGGPTLAFSWSGEEQPGFLTIVSGTPPKAIDEVAIDSVQAAAGGVKAGDRIRMVTPDGEKTFLLTATVKLDISAGAYYTFFDFASAQKLFGKVGQVDTIALTRSPGTSVEELLAAVRPLLPADATVLGRDAVIADQQAQFETVINIFRNLLLAFAGIALFVSLFIIYNTFAILVNQRLQQIGMLRAIGATRGQIRRGILVEAAVVGVVGSAIGIAFGLVVAFLIKKAFQAGGGFPETSTVVAPRTIIVCLIVGLVATAVSALLPAFLAGRVSPVAAMRNEAPARSSVTRRIAIGVVVLAVGLVLLGLGLFVGGQPTSSVLSELALGAIATFIGVALLSVLFAGPAVNLIGRSPVLGGLLFGLGLVLPVLHFTVGKGLPGSALGGIGFGLKMLVSLLAMITGASILTGVVRHGRGIGPGGAAAGLEGRLARQNAARAPQRTAATATALTIGIALVSTVGVVGESLKASFSDTLHRAIKADLFVYDDRAGSPFSAELADRIEQVPGVAAVGRVRLNQVRLGGTDVVGVAGFNVGTGTQLIDFNVAEGSLDGVARNGILVYRDVAESRNLKVGDVLPVEFPDLQTEQLTVAGIFRDNSVLNTPLVVDLPVYQRHITSTQDQYVAAKVAPGADLAAVKAQVVALTKDYSSVTAKDTTEFQQSQEDQVDRLITLINYLLAFALFVAFLGVINTIVLSVIERTREIGLLRAVGMTQEQVRSTIRWESVIVCMFGAVLGIVLGLLFGAAAISAIPEDVISTTAVPWETIAFAILAAALAGVLAAVLPARRAARLNVLNAITTPGT